MNIPARLQKFSRILILGFVLIANEASGQSPIKNTYTGIWAGFAKPSPEQPQKREDIHLFWRVHRIDTVKNEIEITQTGQRFDDGSEIDGPKKAIYKFSLSDAGFSIMLDGREQNSKYKLNLSPLKMQDMIALNGSFERLDKKAESKAFLFAKISDDISEYVKPKGKVEVIVTPPPPIK